MLRKTFGALAALAALGVAAPAVAETRALLAGVWKFNSPQIPDLQGPENDLLALESLLRAQGARDVTVLRNEGVTRTSVETALHALGLRSKPGDWIFFYYSGHGAQAEGSGTASEDGTQDQFIPLSGFNLDKQDAEKFIVDKDFYSWIARYVPPTVQVLMIADACHSGTLHRSVNPRAFRFTPRLALRNSSGGINLASRPAPRFPAIIAGAEAQESGTMKRAPLRNQIYIGAAQDDQLALESSLPVEGAPARGVLTWTFERAMTTLGPDGKSLAADMDQDGTVTVGEISSYLNSQVRALTGQRQEPTAYFVTGTEKIGLFSKIAPPAVAPAPAGPPRPAIFAADPADRKRLAAETLWRPVDRADQADFLWDRGAALVLRRSGDVVAEQVRDVPAVRGVVEKWQAMEALRPYFAEASAKLTIGPAGAGARYAPGADVKVTLNQGTAGAARYATVFNVASDGTVQQLYPLQGDGDGHLAPGQSLPVLEAEAVAPYGADHVVALLTPARPDNFRTLLRTVEGQRGSGRLTDAIKQELARAKGGAALSVGELYTGK